MSQIAQRAAGRAAWQSGVREFEIATGQVVSMVSKALLNRIFANESLTRGLCDPEARILVEWLVEQADRIALRAPADDPEASSRAVEQLCHRARGLSRFVQLWCHRRQRGAAIQLAATERYQWPLPNDTLDPCELMYSILSCESEAYDD
jgi:hypothetical protein